MNIDTQRLVSLVNAFRPVYYFHTAERFYPCDFGDLLKQCSLWHKGPNGAAEQVVPYPHLDSRTIHADAEALHEKRISLPEAHREALRWKEVDPAASVAAGKYKYAVAHEGYFCRLHGKDILVGNLGGGTPTYFDTAVRGGREKTSYENGFPHSPEFWLRQGDSNAIKDSEANCRSTAEAILCANRKLTFSDNPQYCSISPKVLRNGHRYTDLIYSIFLGFNGSISIIPGAYTHLFDIEVVGVRFDGNDVTESSTPIRYYFAQHAGYSWYEPGQCEFMSVRDQAGVVDRKHLVVYLGRESHECYPKPGVWQRIYGFANDLCDQGVLWKPPATYVNNALDDEAGEIRQYYQQHNQPRVVLIPDPDHGQGPEWWYSVTPGILPVHDPGKQYLREGGDTDRASEHPEGGTNIDKAVCRRLESYRPPTDIEMWTASTARALKAALKKFVDRLPRRARPQSVGEPPGNGAAIASAVVSAPGRQVCERSFVGMDTALSKEVIESVLAAVFEAVKLTAAEVVIFDKYQEGWKGQSAGVTEIVGGPSARPIWYHKEDCGAFDLRLWLHSSQSANKRHPDHHNLPGGVRVTGLNHLKYALSCDRPGLLKLKVSAVEEVCLTVNFEMECKPNAGGRLFSPHCDGHALLRVVVDEFEVDISCGLQIPVAIADRDLIRYSVDKDGNCTGPNAAGWFVPNVQYAHTTDAFMGRSGNETESAYGLPLDAVSGEDEFRRAIVFHPEVGKPEFHLRAYIEFGDGNRRIDISSQVERFLRDGYTDELAVSVVNEYADKALTGFIGWTLEKAANAFLGIFHLFSNRVLLELPLCDTKLLSEKLDHEVNKLFKNGFAG